VENAVQHRRLLDERRRLATELEARNLKLQELNASLASKVRVRTSQLQTALQEIRAAHHDLKQHYTDTVRAFGRLAEFRERQLTGHARRVADWGRKLAEGIGLRERDVQDIVLAGLLLQVGKVALRDRLLFRPVNSLTKIDRTEFLKHALTGASILRRIAATTTCSWKVMSRARR
jgi:response regulator RpfG family c-di-GMP phosphodiesterase